VVDFLDESRHGGTNSIDLAVFVPCRFLKMDFDIMEHPFKCHGVKLTSCPLIDALNLAFCLLQCNPIMFFFALKLQHRKLYVQDILCLTLD